MSGPWPDQKPGETPAQTEPSNGPDWWSLWFFRLVQVAGLLGFGHELLVKGSGERPWVLLVTCAMMLGGYGMGLILRSLPLGSPGR